MAKKALQWLHANLESWTRALETGDPALRAIAEREILIMRGDPALASLRETNALKELSEVERGECLTFWREVDALLDRAR